MNIVVLDGYPLNPGDLSWEPLKAFGNLKVYDRTPYNTQDILEAIGDAEIVFTNKTPLSEATLKQANQLKYIGVLATGFNNVDTDFAKSQNIVVTNVPTYSTSSVAQFTMALILELCHHVGAHDRAVHNGDWSKSPYFSFWNTPQMELQGKYLGIIGFGKIGQATAKIAQAFGLNILAYSRSRNKILESDTCQYATLDELLEKSDIISLHCPQTEATAGIINKTSLSKMKKNALLINTSRGGLIIEEDLKNALNSNQIAGAALDVVSKEPIKADNPILSAKNCIITPHIAWSPKASRERLMKVAVENLKSFLDGKPQNVVN